MAPGALLCALFLLPHLGLQSQPSPRPEICGHPEMVTNTNTFEDEDFSEGRKLRYACQTGYKRKAGTSSLIICKKNETSGKMYWTVPNITCIRDTSLASATTAAFVEGLPTTKPTYLTTKTFPPSPTDIITPRPTGYASQPSRASSTQAMTRTSVVPREAITPSTTANATSWPPTGPSSLPMEQSTPQPFTEDSSPSRIATSSSALQEADPLKRLYSLGGLGALIVVLILALLGICVISQTRVQRHATVQMERPTDHDTSEESEMTNMLAVAFLSPDVPNQNIGEKTNIVTQC
ncbi:interleukin-15 receptor subunit alpha [Microcaecilia unicolor]|uniref:Interleukin-15 receptor subunit alpha-like n=1 Tax=Microcaecilia unicolor TaxID=1415580 RepID=A0A6P7Z8W2_9AMPH|nr:interleukin-15 receptor subunit alpha-like [Microcaecilia unicolor]